LTVNKRSLLRAAAIIGIALLCGKYMEYVAAREAERLAETATQ
jgi:hypothetical protein